MFAFPYYDTECENERGFLLLIVIQRNRSARSEMIALAFLISRDNLEFVRLETFQDGSEPEGAVEVRSNVVKLVSLFSLWEYRPWLNDLALHFWSLTLMLFSHRKDHRSMNAHTGSVFEGLFMVLSYLLKDNFKFASDYRWGDSPMLIYVQIFT